MIHEILPHHFDNSFRPCSVPEPDNFILIFSGNSVLLKDGGDEPELPIFDDIHLLVGTSVFIYLFRVDNNPCFLANVEIDIPPSGFRFTDIGFFRTTQRAETAWICLAGIHLRDWYQANQYCGVCGSSTRHSESERALVCSACNRSVYPRISPAVIVAIVCGDHILLARGTGFSTGRYSLVAGYVDVGETPEETVHREVKEELGIAVSNIRYYKSQPWPLSGSLMLGYVAEADINQPLQTDPNEIAEAAWFRRGHLPPHSLSLSIAGEMIEKFEKGEL